MDFSQIDLYDPDQYVEAIPHQMFADLRQEAPVFWHDRPGQPGFWAVTRHNDIVNINRDTGTYSSYLGGVLINSGDEEADLEQMRLMMLNMDPPDHTKLRKLVNKGFTPKRVKDLEGVLTERSTAIVDRVAEQGACDFVDDVAVELPLQAIADLIGIPQKDRRLVFEWSNRMIGSDDPDFARTPEEGQAAAEELFAYAQELASARRDDPQDDIVTALIEAEVDGERLSDIEFNVFFLLLSVAGNETTRNAISHAMLALIEHPDQRQRLLDDMSLLDAAIEEFLRWATPVMNFKRTATRNIELGGQQIREGDRVVMFHISGNYDEAAFADAHTFDVGRAPDGVLDHVAFGGGGPHFCLGAGLARAELRVIFTELLTRIPDMELDGPVARLRSNFINGIKKMPVRFTPVAA